MAYKKNDSPLNQFGSFGRLMNPMNQQPQNMFAGGLSGVIRNAAAQVGAQANQPKTSMMANNVIKRSPAPINPKAMSGQSTIANMYGQAMPGTFNRSMGPLAQMTDPLTGQVIDPTMDQSTAGMNPVIQGDTAVPPPAGVEVPITPIYDINQ
jgi:hypothetical protein